VLIIEEAAAYKEELEEKARTINQSAWDAFRKEIIIHQEKRADAHELIGLLKTSS
jgi:hypothetical protein